MPPQETHGEPAVWPSLDIVAAPSFNPHTLPWKGSLILLLGKQRLRGDGTDPQWYRL